MSLVGVVVFAAAVVVVTMLLLRVVVFVAVTISLLSVERLVRLMRFAGYELKRVLMRKREVVSGWRVMVVGGWRVSVVSGWRVRMVGG